ncbi:19044_t:CDS:2, partial [Dentiscutata erythropus]
CLRRKAWELHKYFAERLEEDKEELEKCRCETSEKVRVDYMDSEGSGWSECEKCEKKISSAGHHGDAKEEEVFVLRVWEEGVLEVNIACGREFRRGVAYSGARNLAELKQSYTYCGDCVEETENSQQEDFNIDGRRRVEIGGGFGEEFGEELKKLLKRVEQPDYRRVNIGLHPNATPAEKAKYKLCKTIARYCRESNLTEKELGKKLGIDQVKTEYILFCHLDKLSLEELVNYTEELAMPLEVKIN